MSGPITLALTVAERRAASRAAADGLDELRGRAGAGELASQAAELERAEAAHDCLQRLEREHAEVVNTGHFGLLLPLLFL